MTTEELIKEMQPLALELDYAEDAERSATVERQADESAITETEESAEHRTKKEQILSLYERGTRDIAEIVRRIKARPSYVAQVLQTAGRISVTRACRACEGLCKTSANAWMPSPFSSGPAQA